MLTIVIGVVAVLATLWGVYYARGQLQEAQKIREQNERFAENQMKDDDLWAEKYIKAAQLLCKIADMDKPSLFGPARVVYAGGPLRVIFAEDVSKRILGQLIERQHDGSYFPRPIETSQLRLKATRDLIDLVLVSMERFQAQKPNESKELGF